MLKKSLFFILFLTAISGAILLIQWISYEKVSRAYQEWQLDQEIHLEHNHTGLSIKHTFIGLEAGQPLSVILPASALNAACKKKEGNCSFRGQGALITPDGETLTISYALKMPPLGSSFVLSDWFIKLKDAKAENTTLHFTEKKIRTGMWFSSLGTAEIKKLDLIDYYMFQGSGSPGELYWQQEPLKQASFHSK
ncbi:hypothetical protein F9802_04345 [Bacillus aerolatus]|uniref:Uncharacterized protein n=1 Tax=Bacillus aerolatus TaxID=2653354 RepID=A0A6I1FHN6_9BACI|nr:hypothetical protein [Bacillus aerolatus]KAB7707951.1 hypothetical protein F9802_04345 [Bacillus aerolatus]